jgi:hypothetical protein
MSETTVVPTKRLIELEELERNVPLLIQTAIERAILQYKEERLKKLREKDKADVTLARERARRYADKHRESINARRRTKRHPEVTTNLLMIEAPHKDLNTDRPGTDHGKPKEGDVVPRPVSPVTLEGASHEHADPSKPKRKRCTKKIDKE